LDTERLDPESLPELTEEEKAAIDSLGPDFVERLFAGDWIAARLRRALEEGNRATVDESLEDLLREHGESARTMIRESLQGLSDEQSRT